MNKKRIVANCVMIGLAAAALSGCTFIVKGENSTKYYGIDEERGSEYLSQIEGKQQEMQGTAPVSAAPVVSEAPVPSHLK